MATTTDPIDYARRGDVDYFKDVDINVLEKSRNDKCDSVLNEAAAENHLDCCKEICRRSPSLIYHKNLYGFTALQTAAWKGKNEIVNFLLHADACVENQGDIESGKGGENAPNKKLLLMRNAVGGTALHMAVLYRNTETVRILVQADSSHEHLSIVDQGKKTALHYAIQFQDLEMVKVLVDQVPDFDYHVDDSGATPLLTAIRLALQLGDSDSASIRSLLIEKQASQIKLRIGEQGWTLLHHAAAKGDLGAIKDIIQFGSDCLEMVDNDRRNFLHLAAMHGHVKVVEHILQIKNISESILNTPDNYEDTPLHIAAKKGNASAGLCLLYDSRVSKTIKNGKGQTAVELITFDYDKERAGVFGVRDAVNEKELKDQSDFDLVVCALIATVSFTAGITVPGGYINDGPNRGMAVLSKKMAFEAFIVTNTCALLLSLSAVFSHFCTRLMHKRKDIDFQVTLATYCTLGAIFTMVVTFITGSYAVLAISKGLAITVCVLSGSFFILAFYAIWRVAMQYKNCASGASTNPHIHVRNSTR